MRHRGDLHRGLEPGPGCRQPQFPHREGAPCAPCRRPGSRVVLGCRRRGAGTPGAGRRSQAALFAVSPQSAQAGRLRLRPRAGRPPGPARPRPCYSRSSSPRPAPPRPRVAATEAAVEPGTGSARPCGVAVSGAVVKGAAPPTRRDAALRPGFRSPRSGRRPLLLREAERGGHGARELRAQGL